MKNQMAVRCLFVHHRFQKRRLEICFFVRRRRTRRVKIDERRNQFGRSVVRKFVLPNFVDVEDRHFGQMIVNRFDQRVEKVRFQFVQKRNQILSPSAVVLCSRDDLWGFCRSFRSVASRRRCVAERNCAKSTCRDSPWRCRAEFRCRKATTCVRSRSPSDFPRKSVVCSTGWRSSSRCKWIKPSVRTCAEEFGGRGSNFGRSRCLSTRCWRISAESTFRRCVSSRVRAENRIDVCGKSSRRSARSVVRWRRPSTISSWNKIVSPRPTPRVDVWATVNRRAESSPRAARRRRCSSFPTSFESTFSSRRSTSKSSEVVSKRADSSSRPPASKVTRADKVERDRRFSVGLNLKMNETFLRRLRSRRARTTSERETNRDERIRRDWSSIWFPDAVQPLTKIDWRMSIEIVRR